MKKLISMLLVLCMVLGMSVSAFAEETSVTVSNDTELETAINEGKSNIVLKNGITYRMPSSEINASIKISGSKDAVLDMTKVAYLDNATLSFEGIKVKTSTGYANGLQGGDYAALYSSNVIYTGCTFDGPMRIGRDGAQFTGCTFTNLGNDYIWNYGNSASFSNCIFKSDGKALLLYSDGNGVTPAVTVTGCTFEATAGAKAGAIVNQNCAAIEIDNYGSGVDLTLSGNTINPNFSGEWRIKSYYPDNESVTVNGQEYTTIALDGKTMTKDNSNNVTIDGLYIVSTQEELKSALSKAEEGDIVKLNADIDYSGSDTLEINKAITLDLGGKTLTTHGTYGGIRLKNNCTLKNGKLVHEGTVTAIKAWNVAAIENLEIDVEFKAEGKVIGGIVIQEGSTNRINTINNVTIKGEGLTNGIETYNCGDTNGDVIGSMTNVKIDAKGTGMLISAPCGTATNCEISGGVSGIEIWIKGTYSASLNLVDCTVSGGTQDVYAHDEVTDKPVVNNGKITLTADGDTEFKNKTVIVTKKRVEDEQVILPTALVTDVSGTITWDDDNDADKIRPVAIAVTLNNGGTIVEEKELTTDTATYKFENIPKFAASKEIVYTVNFKGIEGYTLTQNGFDAIYSHVVEHKHTWSAEWNKNDTHHWHVCTSDGCDVTAAEYMDSYAAHSYTDGKCECGVLEPTAEPEHEHTWSAEWNKNDTHHWYECTVEGCDVTENSQKNGYAAHTYTNGVCVCGAVEPSVPAPDEKPEEKPEEKHEHSWSTEWSKNETHHWHVCTAEGCDVTDITNMSGYTKHSYDAHGNCVCGDYIVIEEDYEEIEVDTHISKGDMEELIDDSSKKDDIVSVDLYGNEDTISYNALKLAAEEGVTVKLDGKSNSYFWRFDLDKNVLDDFKGSFQAGVNVNAGVSTSMKATLKDVANYQIIKTEHEGALPETTILGVKLDKALRSADELYMYYWNTDTKQAEEVDAKLYKEGNYFCVELEHCSTYIITDTPIEAAGIHQGATVVGNVSGDKVNPSTGANDFVGAAVAMAVVSSMGVVVLNKRR